MYLLRLDDASQHMNLRNWKRMESLLDKYNIKPIYGIIPHNEDHDLLKYEEIPDFWNLMKNWEAKGWTPALHGYSHVFETTEGGINPVNRRSEFAGVALDRQKQKIHDGLIIVKGHGIDPKIFFAPAHTFDDNTLVALKEESSIRVISDTVATDVYYQEGFYFIPQQSGRVRNLPFNIVTFCYHPNTMTDEMFDSLESFCSLQHSKFLPFKEIVFKKKEKSLLDATLQQLYFIRGKMR